MAFNEPEFRQLVLTVPGIGVSTYAQSFQYVKFRPGYEYKAVRIYYAEILWKRIAQMLHLPVGEFRGKGLMEILKPNWLAI
jgi:hypothetical protein